MGESGRDPRSAREALAPSSFGAHFLGHAPRRLDQIVALLALVALMASLWLIGLPFIPDTDAHARPLPQFVSNVITLTPIPLMVVEIALGLRLLSLALKKRIDADGHSRWFRQP